MPRKDILLDGNTYEPSIWEGDFEVGESQKQHIDCIVRNAPGDWAEFPLLGAGLPRQLNAPVTEEFLRNITLQVESDGIALKTIVQRGRELDIKF